MKPLPNKNMRSGAALLVIVIFVMVVTVISLGFLSDSNVQMVCGKNVGLRMQMDYHADSGLVIAKTYLLHPQEADTSAVGYWQGEIGRQMGSDDYIDLAVRRSVGGATNRCTYDIQCQSYRLNGADRIAQSYLNAQVRLDPCIAYWAGGNGDIPNSVTINGDVYCNGVLTISGTVEGDAFANSVTGAKTGQTYLATDLSVSYPSIVVGYFSPFYEYDELSYSPENLASQDCNSLGPFGASGSNPAGIVYRQGNLDVMGVVTVDGTLVVEGDLTIRGTANLVITASKNYPALVVSGTVTVEDSSSVTVNGLVQAGSMTVGADAGDIDITGALFIGNSALNVDGAYSNNITVTTAPMISALKLTSGVSNIKWSPAGSAFFKYIKRSPP